MIKHLNVHHYYHNCSQVHRFLGHAFYCIQCPDFLGESPAAILHFICFSYLLSAFLPLCDLVLLSPQDFPPLLRWQGDGLSANKLVHLSIRASVEEVPAIMKLSGRLRQRVIESRRKRLNYGILCKKWRKKTEMSSRCQHICRGNLLGDGTLTAAISVVLRSMNNHPQSLSTRHHQPSVNFNTTLLLTDLLFFFCFFMNGWIHPGCLSHCMWRNP